MDSRIEKHLGRYKSDLGRVGNGEIAAVIPLGLSVDWNEPQQGGQVESFGDDLTGALSFIKKQSRFIMNERYADKEDFPSLNFNYLVKYSNGKPSLSTFDTIICSSDSRRENFNI
jgi:hypothetical protein